MQVVQLVALHILFGSLGFHNTNELTEEGYDNQRSGGGTYDPAGNGGVAEMGSGPSGPFNVQREGDSGECAGHADTHRYKYNAFTFSDRMDKVNVGM